MRSNYWLVLLLSLPCLALECNPDKDEEEKPTYYMSEEFKDYVLFPEGSWWVYETSSTSNTDSVYIASIIERSVISDQNTSFKAENFRALKISSEYDSILSGGGVLQKGVQTYKEYPENKQGINGEIFFSTSQMDSGRLEPSFKNVKYLGVTNNVKINNITHDSVKIFEVLNQEYDSQPHRIYWAKNVGIIKKVLFDSTVWKLKNYHINN
jgi:hypothetical protein